MLLPLKTLIKHLGLLLPNSNTPYKMAANIGEQSHTHIYKHMHIFVTTCQNADNI